MGKMETTTSINAQLPISHIIPLTLKTKPLVGSLAHECSKGHNSKILLIKCFNEHIKLLKKVIVNSN